MKKQRYKKEDFNVGKSLHPKTDAAPTDVFDDVKPKKSRWKRVLVTLLLSVLILFSILVVWNAINISRAAEKMFGSGNILEFISSEPLQKDSNDRVNVLIVGYSVDDPGHPGAKLTDSLLVLSMDPRTKTGYMLSIPRDLYLKIPGEGYGKINEAYQDGGQELLEELVTENLGIDIGYFVLVNYAAVRDTVNALGGITVDIKSSDPRGLYDPNISPVDGGPLQLSNGTQQLDGQTALNLTRARGSTYGSYGFPRSDLTRIEHQKQIFTAIKEKSSSWKLVLNPLKNNELFEAAGNNLKSDLQTGEALPLYRLFASIPSDKLGSHNLHQLNGKALLTDYNGGLVPVEGLNDYSKIQEAIKNLK